MSNCPSEFVRIEAWVIPETHAALRELAAASGRPMADIAGLAVDNAVEFRGLRKWILGRRAEPPNRHEPPARREP